MYPLSHPIGDESRGVLSTFVDLLPCTNSEAVETDTGFGAPPKSQG